MRMPRRDRSKSPTRTLILAAAISLGAPQALHADGIHSPDANYFCIEDSPFFGLGFGDGDFLLEDFEDGKLNTEGVALGPEGIVLLRSDIFSDSVDCDDGVIDGNGNSGGAETGALYSNGSSTMTFTFGTEAFGQLPTHAGIVMTDVFTTSVITLEAFRDGTSLGSVSGVQVSEGQHFTAGDRFYGFEDEDGIGQIVITAATDSDWAMDHLQYGMLDLCPWDLDDDGMVGIADLVSLLAGWSAPYDTNDLISLLAAWGVCD